MNQYQIDTQFFDILPLLYYIRTYPQKSRILPPSETRWIEQGWSPSTCLDLDDDKRFAVLHHHISLPMP